MAKLTRFTMPVFADNAAQTQTSVFGTMKTSPQYTSDVAASIGTTAYGNGWADAIETGYAPYMEDMNTLQKAITYQISYNQQQGIPEWASDTEYYIGSLAKLNTEGGSQIYSSLVDNNVGNLLSDATKWKLVFDTENTYVTTNTSQTITGHKTFQNQNITQSTTNTAAGTYVDFIQNINGARRGTIRTMYNSDGSYSTLFGSNGPDGAAPSGLTVKGTATETLVQVPYPHATTEIGDNSYGNEAVSARWVNSLGNNVVHINGTETITGAKTFSSIISGSINGNAATVTNGVYTIGNQTIGGTKTFSAVAYGTRSDAANSFVTTVNKLKAQNGYFKLGNGLIVQWGYTSTVSGNTTIELPISFSGTNYAVAFGLNVSGHSYAPNIVSKTSATFVYQCIENRKSYWVAIGY